MEDYKEYRELTLEEKMKTYENYQKWFNSLPKEEQIMIDDGGFNSFEDYNAEAWWSNLTYNPITLEVE